MDKIVGKKLFYQKVSSSLEVVMDDCIIDGQTTEWGDDMTNVVPEEHDELGELTVDIDAALDHTVEYIAAGSQANDDYLRWCENTGQREGPLPFGEEVARMIRAKGHLDQAQRLLSPLHGAPSKQDIAAARSLCDEVQPTIDELSELPEFVEPDPEAL
ncbi:hypothetical protein FAZ69_04395 [Trinickia terrae]|uniref:Uncharacterized protein n=1 Tax=Trinickia terrae TaxID=2571161 RepID=A0A4U1IDI3_9BURK|nr:hypothetical protein [Trinickia terrae]TKC91689.1 hypothetical protein FAZ69_04395 [Trinickia terrae]